MLCLSWSKEIPVSYQFWLNVCNIESGLKPVDLTELWQFPFWRVMLGPPHICDIKLQQKQSWIMPFFVSWDWDVCIVCGRRKTKENELKHVLHKQAAWAQQYFWTQETACQKSSAYFLPRSAATADASVISWSRYLERMEFMVVGVKLQIVIQRGLDLTLTRCDYRISI
jgi:hypothetical protein